MASAPRRLFFVVPLLSLLLSASNLPGSASHDGASHGGIGGREMLEQRNFATWFDADEAALSAPLFSGSGQRLADKLSWQHEQTQQRIRKQQQSYKNKPKHPTPSGNGATTPAAAGGSPDCPYTSAGAGSANLHKCAMGYAATSGVTGGFRKTCGGRYPTGYVVTTAEDVSIGWTEGSLRWAMKYCTDGVYITFAKPMTITLVQALYVNGDTTIDGRGHQIVITGGPLLAYWVSNVIFHNLEAASLYPAVTPLSAQLVCPAFHLFPHSLFLPPLSSPRLSSPLFSSPLLSCLLLASPILSSPRLSNPLFSSPLLSSLLLASPILSLPRLSSPLLSSHFDATPPCTSSPVPSPPVGDIPGDTDILHIRNTTRVWVDHLKVYNAARGTISVVYGATDVTVSNTYFHNENFVQLLGAADDAYYDRNLRVTVYRNWYDRAGQRQPHCRWGSCHVANSLYTSWGYYCLGARVYGRIRSERNYFIGGPRKEVTPWFGGALSTPTFDNTGTIRSYGNRLENGSTLHEFVGTVPAFNPPYKLALMEPTDSMKDFIMQNAGPHFPDSEALPVGGG
ncbi:unnamed protein product [Closterium sp. NIES-54]